MAVAIKIWAKVTALSGTPLIRCHYTQGSDNYGTTIEGNETDFASVKEFEALADVEVSGTGWISFDIDPDNVTSAPLYWRFEDMNYGQYSSESITIASTNNATSGDRPYVQTLVVDDATGQIISVSFS